MFDSIPVTHNPELPDRVTPEQYQAAFRAAVEAFERAHSTAESAIAERETAKAALDSFTQEGTNA